MYRHFKSLALVVLALALLSTSFVSSDAAPTRAGLDVWRQGIYQVEVTALAVSPAFCSDQTLFVATYGAGVFWSQDAGVHWRSINKGLGNLRVLALAVSPDYATDGSLFAGTYGGGVFEWNREQGCWVSVGLTGTLVYALVVSSPYAHEPRAPVLKEDVFAATNSGVFKGVFNPKTGEITWTRTPILSNIYACALAISPDYITDMTVFAGTTSGFYIIYIPDDEGTTWTQCLSTTWVCALAVSPDYVTDKTIFVGTYDINPSSYSKASLHQVLRSPAASGVPKGQGRVIKLNVDTCAWQVCREVEGPVQALAVLPDAVCCQHQPAIFAATQQGVFRFCQCGDSPSLVLEQDVSALAVGPGCAVVRIFAGGFVGVFESADEGNSWTECGELPNPVVNAVTLSPNYALDHTVYVATADGVLILKDGSFSSISGGPNDWNVRSLVTTSRPTGGCTLLSGAWSVGVSTTTCGSDPLWVSANLATITPTITHTLGCVNALAVVPDGQEGRLVFAGTCNEGVYTATLATNGQLQLPWRRTSVPSNNISALSATYVTSTIVFAGTPTDGIHRSTDGGLNWEKVSDLRGIHSLAISPNYGQLQFVAFEYSQDQTVFAGTENGIYKSTDGGDSWTPVGPNCPIYALLFSPNYTNDHTIYAGTYGCGVFESCNGGNTWVSMNAGLGNLYVHSLAITPTRPWTLFAGTEGSGLWLYTMSYKIYLPLIMRSYPPRL